MPKNIVYQTKKKGKSVAGEAKGIKRLRTNLQGGGTCDWVPEDETQLIAKVITQDGVYEASDEGNDVYGYSEVTVQGIGSQIMGDLGTITISKNGTYYAANAYTKEELGENLTSSDDTKIGPFYGYKTVIVNVSGGSSGDSSGSGSGDGSGDSSGSEKPTKKKITGKDEDGDEVEVSVDKDGVLKVQKLATEIRLTAKPKFLVYHNGDTIKFTGIKATAYVKSEVYKALEESDLVFPVTTAEGDGGSKQTIPVGWVSDGDGILLTASFEITVNDVQEG